MTKKIETNNHTIEEQFVIDAMEMKRQIQEKFYEETKNLSAEELIAFIRQKIANSEFADFLSQPGPSTEVAPADKKA